MLKTFSISKQRQENQITEAAEEKPAQLWQLNSLRSKRLEIYLLKTKSIGTIKSSQEINMREKTAKLDPVKDVRIQQFRKKSE